MPVKKTAAAKKSASKKTGPAKKSAAKKSPANKATVKNVSKPKTKKDGRGGFHRELNEETGFVVGTDQDLIAQALLEGGESRTEIAERLSGQLETETRNGTEKQIVNMVSGVLNKMLSRGFTVEQSFVVVPPTAASKRAATRAANKKTPAKKTAAPAKKTAAKKTAGAKRGPGRPKGSKNKK